MIDKLMQGKVARGSAEFNVLQAYALAKLAEIYPEGGVKGFLAKAAAHLALSKLNARLSFYGWAINREGDLFEVPVRGELPAQKEGKARPAFLSVEEMEERVRSAAVETGRIIDPMTGRSVPKHNRFKYGAS